MHQLVGPDPENPRQPRTRLRQFAEAKMHPRINPNFITHEAMAALRAQWSGSLAMFPMCSAGTLSPSQELEVGRVMAARLSGVPCSATLRASAIPGIDRVSG